MQLRALLLGLATTLSLATVATATSASASATATGLKNKPSEAPHLKQITNVGCFNSSKGLEFNATLTYNSDGECGSLCQNKTYNVGATTGGSDCWCGNFYPPASSLTDDTECNMPCTGYDLVACGGANAWSVYNTGVKLAVSNYEEPSSTVSTSAPTATSTGAATTSTTSSSDEDSGGSSKTVGIAVGVVAGILGVAAVVGGIVWYLRKKRNQEIEEEHRRNAAVNAFINGSNPPGSSAGSISMTDSRLDPVLAHRRLSDGSIADNEDYSRKILRVTNA